MFGVDQILKDLKTHLDKGLGDLLVVIKLQNTLTAEQNDKLDRLIELLEENNKNGQTKLGSDVHDDVLPSSESE